MVAHLKDHRTNAGHHVAVGEHHTLGIARRAGRIAHRAQILRRRSDLRVIALGAQFLHVDEGEYLNAPTAGSLQGRLADGLDGHYDLQDS